MKKITILILILLLFTTISNAKEKKYIYTLIPMPTPFSYIKENKVIVSSKNVAISVKQVKFPDFAKEYKIFKTEPNTTFIYLEFSLKNRTKRNVELDINFISLESNKEFRKPLNYDQILTMIRKIYPSSQPEQILQKQLLDFMSPILPNGKKNGFLIFRNFTEKAKNAVLKIDNITVDNSPVSVKIPYDIERRKIIIE